MNSNQLALRKVIRDYAHHPFEYGVLDCAHFAALVVQEAVGEDYTEAFKYHDAESAVEFMGDDYVAKVSEVLSREPVAFEDTTEGDPVMIRIPTVGATLGVKFSASQVVLKTKKGVMWMDDRNFIAGWSVCPKL